MDAITKALKTSAPVPKQIAIGAAEVDAKGRVVCMIGYVEEDGDEAHLLLKRNASPAVAAGVVAIINGVREQVGATDDTPYTLDVTELATVLLGAALGKR